MIKKFNEYLGENSEWSDEDRQKMLKNLERSKSTFVLPYKGNNKSRVIFIQDNMDDLSDELLEEMCKIIRDNVSKEDIISNDINE